LGLQQVDSIVADGRLDVCDASYIAFVMKKGRGRIAAVCERSHAMGAESHPSKRSCEETLSGRRLQNQECKARLQRSIAEPPKAKFLVKDIVTIVILGFFTASRAKGGAPGGFGCSAGHFSKRVRSGTPPVISVEVQRQNPVKLLR